MSRWTQSGMVAPTQAQKIAGLMRAGDADGDRKAGEREARSIFHAEIEAGADLITFAGEVERAVRTWPYFDEPTDDDLEAAESKPTIWPMTGERSRLADKNERNR